MLASLSLNTFLNLGIMIFVGMAVGRLMKLIKLPNVTGYLLAGLLIGPGVLGLLSEEFVSDISIISDCALGFIAFSIGNEFKISYFKRVGATPIVIACLESFFAVVFVLLFGFNLFYITDFVLLKVCLCVIIFCYDYLTFNYHKIYDSFI